MEEWRATDPEGGSLSEDEGKHIAQSVTTWIVTRYKPKRPRPKSTRQQRRIERDCIPLVVADLIKEGKKPSVRNVARDCGISKSKAARLMNAKGIEPKRDAVVSQLSAPAQRLYRILAHNVPRDYPIVLKISPLIRYVWPPHPVIDQKKSAKSMQRKRFGALVNEISKVKLYQMFQCDNDLLAIRRLGRWKRLEDVSYFVELATQGIIPPPELPPQESPAGVDLEGLFWTRPEVELCVSLVRVARQRDLTFAPDALSFVLLTRDHTVDEERLLRAMARAMDSGLRCCDYLYNMAEFRKERDPAFARAVMRLVRALNVAFPHFRYRDDVRRKLRTMLEDAGYLERLENHEPEAAARVRKVLSLIPDGERDATFDEVLAMFKRLAREEIEDRKWALPKYKLALERAIETIPF